jgi:nucleoside-diphosphate-sugar epimerase
MKILIIGGARFIGLVVAKHLLEAGHDIVLFHRNYLPEIPYRQIKGNCEIIDELYNGIQTIQPDVIIHTTAMFERQIKAVEQALSGNRTRMVLLSSVDVYKAYEVLNRLSDTPVQPVPIYEWSPLRDVLYPYRGRLDMDIAHDYEKILVERAALESAVIDAVILRLGMVYGKNDYNHRFLEPIRKMHQGNKRIELPKSMADFRACKCYVENIAHGVKLAVESTRSGEIYNLAAEEILSEMEWYQQIAKLMNWKGEISVTEEPVLSDSFNLEQHFVIDISKIQKQLSYKEIFSIQDSLLNTIQWELETISSQSIK